jgi:F-type H+-transporting ATPase subunit gamma
MEMVAAAKIRKAQQRIEAARPYALQMMEVLANVAENAGIGGHPLLESREPSKRTVLVVLTTDRGLCGAANANILRRADKLIERERAAGAQVDVYAIGRKAINYFNYIELDLLEQRREISDNPKFSDAKAIADKLIKLYVDKEIDKIVVIFNHFKSAMEQKPVEHVLLPIKKEAVDGQPVREAAQKHSFEPDDEHVLDRLLPTYVQALVYRALLESSASEHGARRTAMKSATDNAGDLIDLLRRSFNRARQAAITQEIAEIVGGAEALVEKK